MTEHRPKLEHVTPLRWQVFLGIVAAYLVVHFAHLLAWSPQLFSSEGLLPDASELPTYPFFPNLLFVWDSPLLVQGFVLLLIMAALAVPFRRWQIPAALLLWYGWAALLSRSPFIGNPGMPYVGWMLLAIALVAFWNKGRRDPEWRLPAPLFWWAWFFLGAGYTLSGIHKLGSPSWQEGLALTYLLESPLVRPGVISGVLHAAPGWVLQFKTWGTMALEVMALPVMLLSWGRPLVWLALVGMHLGIMLTLGFVDHTLGMLLMHLFVFDERWLRPRGNAGVVYFDGVCNLCNQFVDTLIGVLWPGALKVASLQGETAKREFGDRDLPDSIVYFVDGQCLTHSDAIVGIGRRLGGFFRLLAEVVAMIPRPLRDWGYRLVARNRYLIFGKSDSCRLPTPAETRFFLP